MIKIEIKYLNKTINNIIISGHSGYAEMGKDIICASVSSIAITTINAILKLDNQALIFKESDGYLEVNLMHHNEYIDTLIYNMVDLFKELETKYKKYIKIK